jgi:uncharacterized membrane protein (UPF0127 family)
VHNADKQVVRVQNSTRGVSLGDSIAIASDSKTRRTGLLRHRELAPGEGLWIARCEAVHTFGMKFAIDVAFLSRSKRILKIRRSLAVRRISICLRAYSVLELPAGMLDATGTGIGDQLEFDR